MNGLPFSSGRPQQSMTGHIVLQGGKQLPAGLDAATERKAASPSSKAALVGVHVPCLKDPLKLHTSRDLVLIAQSGHEWALTELFTRSRSQVFRSLYRITRNREDAEDALQDAMLRVFLKLHTFDHRSSFSTWFTRICINSALMILRKRGKSHFVSIEDAAEADTHYRCFEIVDPSPDPRACCLFQEAHSHLKTAVQKLPKTLRIVAEAREADQGSMKEMAESLGISIPATKSRLLRARSRIRGSLLKQCLGVKQTTYTPRLPQTPRMIAEAKR